MENSFFITGVYRSGTTLLDKLLHMHPQLIVGSQPFPVLYFFLKQRFLEDKNISKIYPMDPLFMEDAYQLSEFITFLHQYHLTRADLDSVFTEQKQYSGALTRGFTDFCLEYGIVKATSPKLVAEVCEELFQRLSCYYKKPDALWVGTKEIICEEFIPWFLSRGTKVIHILRDPRDIIASLLGSADRQYMGNLRPILYTLRMWRKSVAFLLAYEGQPDYLMIRYEDLVRAPIPVLNKITEFLDVKPFTEEVFSQGIKDQNENLWIGNSSFGEYQGVSTRSIGKYRSALNKQTIQYIELVCAPELRVMGYNHTALPKTCIDSLDAPQLNERVESTRFERNYSSSPVNLAHELTRLKKLTQDLCEHEAQYWFIFEAAYRKLSELYCSC